MGNVGYAFLVIVPSTSAVHSVSPSTSAVHSFAVSVFQLAQAIAVILQAVSWVRARLSRSPFPGDMPTAKFNFLTWFLQRLAYFETLAMSSSDATSTNTYASDLLQAFATKLDSLPCLDACTKIIKAVGTSGLPVDAKTKLLKHIDEQIKIIETQTDASKAISGSGSVQERTQAMAPPSNYTRAQECNGFQNYVKGSQWPTLTDPNIPIGNKLLLLVQLCCELLIFRPSEKLTGIIVSLTGSAGVHLAGALGYQAVQDFKKALAAVRPSGLIPANGIMDYPEHPRMLPTSIYARTYANEAPGVCPWPSADRMLLKSAVSLRNTNGTLRLTQPLVRQERRLFKLDVQNQLACIESPSGSLRRTITSETAPPGSMTPSQLGSLLMNELGRGAEGVENLHTIINDYAQRHGMQSSAQPKDLKISMSPTKQNGLEDLAQQPPNTNSAQPSSATMAEPPAANIAGSKPGMAPGYAADVRNLLKRKGEEENLPNEDESDEEEEHLPRRKRAKAKAKAKAKAMPKTKAKGPASSPTKPETTEWIKEPPCGTKCPLQYHGCKIYHVEASSKWRVYPKQGSRYDKTFAYNASNKKKIWATIIAFCKNASIPKTSVNYVK